VGSRFTGTGRRYSGSVSGGRRAVRPYSARAGTAGRPGIRCLRSESAAVGWAARAGAARIRRLCGGRAAPGVSRCGRLRGKISGRGRRRIADPGPDCGRMARRLCPAIDRLPPSLSGQGQYRAQENRPAQRAVGGMAALAPDQRMARDGAALPFRP